MAPVFLGTPSLQSGFSFFKMTSAWQTLHQPD
jgi:hypothetical protein